MFMHIEKAEYVSDYRIRLVFSDAAVGEVDLKDDLWGEVFEPLRDLEKFRNFSVDPEMKTLVWKNGADFAPEFLRRKLQRPALPRMLPRSSPS